MTTTAHPSSPELSAFLDGQLRPERREAVARHVATCSTCEGELRELRSLVRELASLERLAPPQSLDLLVQRRIALELHPDRTWLSRLEGRLEHHLRSPLLLLFSLVIAFALLLYGLAATLHRQQQGSVPVELDPGAAAIEMTETALLGGRQFVSHGGVWWQVEVDRQAPVEAVEWESEEARAFLRAHPELHRLPELQGPVVVAAGDGPLQLGR